jgi:hypothetical protein
LEVRSWKLEIGNEMWRFMVRRSQQRKVLVEKKVDGRIRGANQDFRSLADFGSLK